MRYFVDPPADFYRAQESRGSDNIYCGNWLPDAERERLAGNGPTYTEYNYLGGGLSARIKARHFEVALRLTRHLFGTCHAIDLGCADGVFLPSLSRYFRSVCAIERHPPFAQLSARLVETCGLDNVTTICNRDLGPEELRCALPERDYRVLFLLEVMEHVGERQALYESKLRFLEQVANLLTDDAIIVMSVPKMVGLSFLVQRMGLAALRISREPISMRDLLKASLLGDTSDLEKDWHSSGHLGFNHRKLEAHLARSRFRIARKQSLMFQNVYVLDWHRRAGDAR